MSTTAITSNPIAVNPALVASIVETVLAKISEAPDIAPVLQVVPRGQLGTCQGCGQSVLTHFDQGEWVGCLKGRSDMVYTLVPHTIQPRGVNGQTSEAVSATGTHAAADAQGGISAALPGATRGFTRARYYSRLHHRAKVENLDLSPTRSKVLHAIHATSKSGIIAKQIKKRAGLPHGSVQQTLNWLRAHDLVRAAEDTAL